MACVWVVIPAFNPSAFLTEAVKSVVAQTFTDWRLLIVDDGSTVGFPDLPADSRIQIVRKSNGGSASARNFGLDRAPGKYVAFLDSDDRWVATKLDRQVAIMEARPDVQLCATQFEFIDSVGAVKGFGYGRAQSRLDLLATGNGICTSSVMIRNGPERFRPDLVGAEDFDLWLRLIDLQPCGFVPTVETCYRHHGGNRSRSYQRVWRGVQQVYASHPHPAAVGGLAAYRKVFAHQAWDAARQARLPEMPRHLLNGAVISPPTIAGLVFQTARSRATSLASKRGSPAVGNEADGASPT